MAITENSKELRQILWDGADILRSKMDANDYKDYLLGFVFYKYLSDKLLMEAYDLYEGGKPNTMIEAQHVYEEAYGDDEFLQELREKIRYSIQPDVTYTKLADKAEGNEFQREDLQRGFNEIQESDPIFDKLFADVDLYSPRLGTGDLKQSQTVAELLKKIWQDMDSLEDLCDLVQRSIQDEPPLAMKEGNIIRDGYNEEVDKLRRAKSDGKDWLAKLENDEREKTGIKNLKIKYNKVFGYYLEVTNSYKDLVPDYYTRKQTLANAERYITPELKELEDMILGAEDKLYALEYDLYCEVRDTIASQVERIQQTAKAVAALDVFASLALVAERNNYVRPKINEKGVIDIKEGRHPVVERMIPNDMFISNDTYLDDKKHRISIITGPNMAGKSTYMRQTALIALMAQVGSFVPAQSANICISDRIFTRVGASDDLASGQSTFMVEMTEVAFLFWTK